MGKLLIKRAYDPPASNDDYGVLVYRLWRRGASRDRVELNAWLKAVAPSPQLRTLWGHDASQLDEFTRRCCSELNGNPAVDELRRSLRQHPRLTRAYSPHGLHVNHSVVVRDYRGHGNGKE